MKKQLINNSIIGLIQFILTAILTLLSVPVFINKLGFELYGIFALVSVIGNLNLLTNLGLNRTLMVFVAKQGKTKESDFDIAVTFIIMAVVMFFVTFIIIIFKDFIVLNILSVPEKYFKESRSLMIFLIISNSILLIGQTFTAVINALQKIYLTSIIQFIYSVIYWGGLILVVSIGGGLATIGLMALLAAIIWIILVFIVYRNLWGRLDLHNLINNFKRIMIKQISYGSKIYLSGLVNFLFEPLSKVLLSNFIGINAVALFEIGSKLRGQISGIITKILYPFFPFIASKKNSNDLKLKVFDLSKKIQLLVIPFSLIIGFTLTILIKFWIGEENFKDISLFTISLTIPLLLLSPPILPIYQYLAAKDMADKNVRMQLVSVIVNIIIFFIFYKFLGLYTVLLSNAFGYLSSYMLGNYYQIKYLEINFSNEVSYYLRIIVYGVGCVLLCIIVNIYLPLGLWDLIIYPLLVIGSFVFYIRITKLITTVDLERYFSTLPFLKNKLERVLISK